MHDLAMRCFHLSPIVHVPWQGQMIAVLLLAVLGGATAARRLSGQGTQPMDVDAQPLCSATIYYGASVGDASKKETADVPIYVGRFDVVVAQPQVVTALLVYTTLQCTRACFRGPWVIMDMLHQQQQPQPVKAHKTHVQGLHHSHLQKGR